MGDAVGGGFGEALDVGRVPLHHPADGPAGASRPLRVPRNGEEFLLVNASVHRFVADHPAARRDHVAVAAGEA